MPGDMNSRITRVFPVFNWLWEHGGPDWPRELLKLAGDDELDPGDGPPVVYLDPERRVPPSRERLAWMLEHHGELTAAGKKNAETLAQRTADQDAIDTALANADTELGKELTLEGYTSADCLIECDNVVIWIEGKRTNKLAKNTSYDGKRDQVARNLEAAHQVANGKDFRVIVCFEEALEQYEQALIDGYRDGTLTDGLPRLDDVASARRLERVAGSRADPTQTWIAQQKARQSGEKSLEQASASRFV